MIRTASIVVTEGVPFDLVEAIEITRIESGHLMSGIRRSIASLVASGFPSDRVMLLGSKITFTKAAGVFTAAIGSHPDVVKLKLHVVPKYIGSVEPENTQWMNDLRSLSASASEQKRFQIRREATYVPTFGSYSDSAKRMLLLLESPRRQDLWSYRRSHWEDFNITGDVSTEDFLIFNQDGFKQSGLIKSDGSMFWSVINKAISILINGVDDEYMRPNLSRHIRPDIPSSTHIPDLPPRLQEWSELYEHSKSIITMKQIGQGIVHYHEGSELFATESIWEKCVLSVFYNAFKGGALVVSKASEILLGSGTTSGDRVISPDVGIREGPGGKFVTLADAKYKDKCRRSDIGSRKDPNTYVRPADLYQSISMCLACGCGTAFLVFPMHAEPSIRVVTHETISVEARRGGIISVVSLLMNTNSFDPAAAASSMREVLDRSLGSQASIQISSHQIGGQTGTASGQPKFDQVAGQHDALRETYLVSG